MRVRNIELLMPFFKASVISVIITSYPLILHEYNLTFTDLGLIATIYYTCAFIGSILWTSLTGRMSRLGIFGIGGCIWSCGTIFIIISNSYVSLLILSGIIGLGVESTTLMILNAIIDTSSPTNRGRRQSYFWIINGVGTIFGWIFAGILEGIYSFNWKIPLILIGIFALIATLLVSRVFNSQVQKSKNIVEQSGLTTFFQQMDGKVTKSMLRDVLTNPINCLLLVACLIFFPFNSNNNIWLQQYFISVHELTQPMATIAIVFTSGGEFLGLLIGGWFIDKYLQKIPHKRLGLAIILTIVNAPLFFFAFYIPWQMASGVGANTGYIDLIISMVTEALQDPNIFLAFILMFFGFFVLTILSIIVPLAIIDYNSPRTRTLSLNLMIITFNSGWIIGPILGGYIGEVYGLKALFLIEPFIFLIIGFLFVIMFIVAKKHPSLLVPSPISSEILKDK